MVAGLQAAQPERDIMRNVDELHQPNDVGRVSIELATHHAASHCGAMTGARERYCAAVDWA